MVLGFLIFVNVLYFFLFRLATSAIVLGRRGHRSGSIELGPAKIGDGPARSGPRERSASRLAHIRLPSGEGNLDGLLLETGLCRIFNKDSGRVSLW